MKHILSIISAALLLTLHSAAQSPAPKEKIHFTSNSSLAILVGGSGEGANVQTINGIRYKKWSTGIGIGIDWYGIRSIPLVLDVRRFFTDKKNTGFVYGNAGINFAWDDGYYNGYTNGAVEVRYKKAFCGEAGIGYRMQLKNKSALVFSTGFSYKEMGVTQINYQGGVVPGYTKTTSSYEYYYRRIAVRVGLNF